MVEGLGFARKYRSNNFKDYIGNQDLKDTVMRYLRRSRPQSILITGPSGCGKTTMGRIIEKEYLCEDRDEETGACGECLMCQEMDNYIKTGVFDNIPDVYEIDATESSSKSNIDSVLSTIDYPASAGGWKIYLFDEVHKLSDSAMSRLLKVLEEPPENVLMILCTTNPEQLLDTIKNRCQLKLVVTKPTTTELTSLLKRICLDEEKDYDLAGLRMIASRADFVIRDSLNFLETVLTTRGDATAASVSEQYKQVSDKIVFDFYEAYLEKDYLGYTHIMYEIKTKFGFPEFMTSLSAFTLRGIYIINGVNVEGLSAEELTSYSNLFRQFKIEDISYILSSLKKMSLGDIETNLMAFIYKVDNKAEEDTDSFATPEGATELPSESKFRNNNLQRLEKARLDEGAKVLAGELQQPVSISDMSSLFQLEKVN